MPVCGATSLLDCLASSKIRPCCVQHYAQAVQEYGGGDYVLGQGAVYFSNFA